MKRADARERVAALAAWAAAAALQLAWALRTPVGSFNDDAVHIVLALGLRFGRFMMPDGLGQPATYPQPGFPLLLAPLAWAAAPHWGLLRFAALAADQLLVWATWRLARRFLDERTAAAAALLVAFNNVLMFYAGAVMPDVLFAACAVLVLAACAGGAWRTRRGLLGLAAGAGFAGVLRPEGALLIAAVALGLAAARELRRAAAFAALAVLPLAAWSARNALLGGTASGYLVYWRQMGASWNAAAQLVHAARVVATYAGEGLLGLVGLPFAVLLAGGLAAWALIARGAWDGVRRREPAAVAAAAYAAALLALHLAWGLEVVRYLIPLLPVAWVLALRGAAALAPRRPRAALAVALVFALAALRLDVLFLRGRPAAATVFPETMAWLQANVEPGTRVQSTLEGAVMLLAGKPAIPVFTEAMSEEVWRSACRAYAVRYVLVDSPATARSLPWLFSGRAAAQAYRNDAEGTLVYRLAD